MKSDGVLFFITIVTFDPALTVNSSTSYFISAPNEPILTTVGSAVDPPPHAINSKIDVIVNIFLNILFPLFKLWKKLFKLFHILFFYQT